MQHSEGHTKPVCQICGKDFWTRGDLRVHIKRHMNRGERGGECRWSCVRWNNVCQNMISESAYHKTCE